MPKGEVVRLARTLCVGAVCLLASGALAQDRVDARLVGERVFLVVPVTGSGTLDDPKRPVIVPKAGEDSPFDGYTWVASDDGQLAIVMLVTKDPQALRDALSDLRVRRAFQKGKHKRNDIEQELKKVRKDFDLDRFLGGVQ